MIKIGLKKLGQDMIMLLKFNKQTVEVTMNGHTTEHRLSFVKKLSLSDFMHYVDSENKKAENKS